MGLFVCCLGVLMDCPFLCAGTTLDHAKGPYVVPGIESRSVACKKTLLVSLVEASKVSMRKSQNQTCTLETLFSSFVI